MSKQTKGLARRKHLTGVYRKVFGNFHGVSTKEIARALIVKFSIPYVPTKEKMESFVSSWIRENKPEFVPAPRIKAKSQMAKDALSRPVTTFVGGRNRPSVDDKEEFYKSWDWRTLRMKALKQHGARCQCCGATKDSITITGDAARIVVDHIEPLSKRWDLRLSLPNLQVLCEECNMGKGGWDNTDWRYV